MMSNDAGKTWKIMRTPHGDNHDIWINPNNTNIWIQSNDGGANITFNGGKSWTLNLTNQQQKFIKWKLIISIHLALWWSTR